MARHRNLRQRASRHDAAYRQAKQEGFAARAVYKLEELDRRFRLLAPGKRVLDLGCWPGSWLQYAANRVGPEGRVVGIDRRPVEIALPSWVTTIAADVGTIDARALLTEFGPFDVVLSDLGPHTTGDRLSDQWNSEELFLIALATARTVLRPGGHFAAKVFQGGRFKIVLGESNASFQTVKPTRASTSRTGSIEQYVVARGFRGP